MRGWLLMTVSPEMPAVPMELKRKWSRVDSQKNPWIFAGCRQTWRIVRSSRLGIESFADRRRKGWKRRNSRNAKT